MTFADFAKEFASQTNRSQAVAERDLRLVFGIMTNRLRMGEPVKISDFGSFEVLQTPERKGISPQGDPYLTPSKRRVKFKQSINLL